MDDDSLAVKADHVSAGQLDALVEGLNRGEETAIQRAYRVYQPFLRMIVRRRLSTPLRTRVDSLDIVQSIWADLLPVFRRAGWQFPDAQRLRCFLARVARNRLVDRQRKHAHGLARELAIGEVDQHALSPARNDAPSQCLQAAELWERMLASCPPAHREILLLKRSGLTSTEIAARIGMHEGSVRRILCDLARRLGHDVKAGSSATGRSGHSLP